MRAHLPRPLFLLPLSAQQEEGYPAMTMAPSRLSEATEDPRIRLHGCSRQASVFSQSSQDLPIFLSPPCLSPKALLAMVWVLLEGSIGRRFRESKATPSPSFLTAHDPQLLRLVLSECSTSQQSSRVLADGPGSLQRPGGPLDPLFHGRFHPCFIPTTWLQQQLPSPSHSSLLLSSRLTLASFRLRSRSRTAPSPPRFRECSDSAPGAGPRSQLLLPGSMALNSSELPTSSLPLSLCTASLSKRSSPPRLSLLHIPLNAWRHESCVHGSGS